ncbi:MAG: 50S ribosomal protein L22 [Terriglobales bacterium]
MESKAEARFVRVSPQKARLVVDLIRGRRAGQALELLAVTRKRMAGEIAKVLRSAIANATQKDDQLDVDDLFVVRAYVNDGPRLKRIRPAPMGRAYRYQRRLAHIAVHVADRQQALAPRPAEAPAAAPAAPPRPAPARPRPAAAKKAPSRPPRAGAKKPRAKGGAAKPKAGAKGKAGAAPKSAPAAKPKRGGAASKPGNKSGGGKSGS